MTGWFYGPLIGAAIWTLIWVAAAHGYNGSKTYPRSVSMLAFGGPVREYVLPGSFIAALACLLTALFADPVASYKPMANALQAAALLFTAASLLGFVLYQALQNMTSQNGRSVQLKSFGPLALLGAIYALLSSGLVTILLVILLSLWMPAKLGVGDDKPFQAKQENVHG